AILALLHVGMNHVKRTRHCRHAQTAHGKCPPNALAQAAVNLFRHRRQPDARHVELHVFEAMRANRIQRRVECFAGKWLGKDADFHYTVPVASASRMHSPVSAERAIATIARMAATPSSIVAPCCGVWCRIVSAKPSICNL